MRQLDLFCLSDNPVVRWTDRVAEDSPQSATQLANQQQAQRARQQLADICAADWNAVHAALGSFADEHSTL